MYKLILILLVVLIVIYFFNYKVENYDDSAYADAAANTAADTTANTAADTTANTAADTTANTAADAAANAAAAKLVICNYELDTDSSHDCIGINGAFVYKKSIAYDTNSANMKKDVLLKYEAPYTYIVSTDNKDIKYYEGPIKNYKPCDWDKYAFVENIKKQKYQTYNKCAADAAAGKQPKCNYELQNPDRNNCIGINGAFIDKKSIAYDTKSGNSQEVYLKYEEPYTYIVSDYFQEIRFYEGPITNYKPCDWNTYAVISDTNKERYKTYNKCAVDTLAKLVKCNYELQNPDSNNCIGINGAFIDKKSIAYDAKSGNTQDVYLKYEEPYTYIVSADNEDIRFYEGPITNYKSCDWDTYAVISDTNKERYKTYDKCAADIAAVAKLAKM
jgi:hypothetical protein